MRCIYGNGAVHEFCKFNDLIDWEDSEIDERDFDEAVASGTVNFFSEKISLINEIVELDCFDAALTEFPSFLATKLHRCSYFNFGNNQLTSLPENLSLPNCTVFRMENNRLYELPRDMQLPECERFFVYGNHLKSLPENIGLRKCTNFCIFFNAIEYLPRSLSLPCCEIFLAFENKLREFPPNIGLEKCREFYVQKNELEFLPARLVLKNCQRFWACNNNLKSLPYLLNLSDCVVFQISNNKISALPKSMNLEKCKKFIAWNNCLERIPSNILLDSCEIFDVSFNRLQTLPARMQLKKCREFFVFNNRLELLPVQLSLANCIKFFVSDNQLRRFPESIDLQKAQIIEMDNNCFSELPMSFLLCRNLYSFKYDYDRIHIVSPQLKRFLHKMYLRSQGNVPGIYGDAQNVHDSAIQKSLRESMLRILSRTDLLNYDDQQLRDTLNLHLYIDAQTKELLFKYIEDNTAHSVLHVKYKEILWCVLQIIEKDFQRSEQAELYSILSAEIQDSKITCFTGRLSRLLNTLNGFSKLVTIELCEHDQIFIIISKSRIDLGCEYTVERHKEIVERELIERGYSTETVENWVAAIDE